MRKILCLVFAATLISSCFTGAAAAAEPPGRDAELCFFVGQTVCLVNGEARRMDVAPVVREGRTLLPIRFVAEPLGATVSWDGGERKVTITAADKVIELWIGKAEALVNGSPVLIDPENPLVKPEILSGRTMLPLRFVGENLGAEVQWHGADRSITVVSRGEKTITLEELADELEKLDASVERSDTRVVEFEKVKGLDLGNYSLEEIAKIMLGETAQIERFEAEDVLGCSASAVGQGAEVLILKFPDSLSAGKYMILLQSELEQAEYALVERLDYSEVALYYSNPDNPCIYVLQRGSCLIMVKEVR